MSYMHLGEEADRPKRVSGLGEVKKPLGWPYHYRAGPYRTEYQGCTPFDARKEIADLKAAVVALQQELLTLKMYRSVQSVPPYQVVPSVFQPKTPVYPNWMPLILGGQLIQSVIVGPKPQGEAP